MTLKEHARAIEAAIQTAAASGFELDDGYGVPPSTLLLNEVVAGELDTYIELQLPPATYL